MDLSRRQGQHPEEWAHPVERHPVDDLAQEALRPQQGEGEGSWSVAGQLLNYKERAEWRFSLTGSGRRAGAPTSLLPQEAVGRNCIMHRMHAASGQAARPCLCSAYNHTYRAVTPSYPTGT